MIPEMIVSLTPFGGVDTLAYLMTTGQFLLLPFLFQSFFFLSQVSHGHQAIVFGTVVDGLLDCIPLHSVHKFT